MTITNVGAYMRDSYDFNGDQPLGCWNVCTNKVEEGFFCSGSAAVTNGDFRDWRTANGKGGDFVVYSDVKTTTLSSPEVFYLP